MKKVYYYVQRCPKCGSRVTGEFKKRPKFYDDEIYSQRQHLKNGELVQFVDEVPETNCFCEECGHMWQYNVEAKWISKERKEEEKKARMTLPRLLEFNEEHPRKKSFLLRKIFGK